MEKIIEFVKDLIKYIFKSFSEAEAINDLSDYLRVKKWVKKVNVLYPMFTVLAVIEIIIAGSMPSIFPFPAVLVYTLIPFLLLLTNWGYATLIMYLPQVFKSVVKSGVSGYKVGEKIETTHVEVTHDFGNHYRVSSYTENQGCFFAYMAGMIRFLVWAFFCVYIGPFVIYRKYKASKESLQNYKA